MIPMLIFPKSFYFYDKSKRVNCIMKWTILKVLGLSHWDKNDRGTERPADVLGIWGMMFWEASKLRT